MSNVEMTADATSKISHQLREMFAHSLGVREERKEQLYLEILQSASLRDLSYWLQVIFSAGIATLGLVLNSVAVIIGAMLISPLMNPILASGLALAAGDLILAVRALVNLALSCLVAVALAVLLVGFLPFKEMTAEIAARTQPTTLDLMIALFSGAVGSIAICKEVKGVVTSIPGVAIAVALMPPLCVTGYGLGIAFSLNAAQGMQVARGGGLLFLTNLIAITFTAMIVFLLLHIDTPQVKARVREWREKDETSRKVRGWLRSLPGYERLRMIGSLPARLLLISVLLLLIFVPLSKSFARLKAEIAQQQRDNRARQAAMEIWKQNFAQTKDGAPRCYIGNVEASEHDGKLSLLLRVFTGKPYKASEKAEYVHQLASRLHMQDAAIAFQLIEIPSTSGELLARAEKEKQASAPPAPAATPAPSVAASQSELQRLIAAALDALPMPAPARLLNYETMLRPDAPLALRINYLSPRAISSAAQSVLTESLRTQLADANAQTSFVWIEAERQLPAFKRNQAVVTDEAGASLASIADTLRQFPDLRVEITTGADRNEKAGIATTRAEAVAAYLNEHWQIPPARISQATSVDAKRNLTLTLKLPNEESVNERATK
jgi:uncharacterized hydrophobic protein (TIGR00271 family)